MRPINLIVATACLLALSHTGAAQDMYGEVDFETSCDGDVAETFNHAVAMLHHMMYGESEALFRNVADADPDCAMAQWGIAMTQLHPLWAPPTADEYARGRAASEKALELGPATDRETAYVEAIHAFFHTEGAFPTRLKAWDAAQTAVYVEHPGDVDAAAFHALARLATAPPDDKAFARQAETGELLEQLLQDYPEHPGLFHYTIHAYDNPVLAERAVDVARAYDSIAPEVPHALHMPSHIFVRLGYWEDVVSWNRRSADAALKHPAGETTSMHYVHAIDYLVYGYLQMGMDEKARGAISEALGHAPYQPHLATAYGLAAPPARVALERRAWSEAAALPVREPAEFDWASFPAAESITWFARGIGAAVEGNASAAQEAIARLADLHAALIEAEESYWAVHTDAQRVAVDAWIAYAEGRTQEALASMREAADLEDSVDKHPVTPSSVLPMRELLGEMLLRVDRPADALEAFEASMAISPGRLNSLSGAGRAAELKGDRETAAAYYGRVDDLLAGRAPVERPRMAEAYAFLNGE